MADDKETAEQLTIRWVMEGWRDKRSDSWLDGYLRAGRDIDRYHQEQEGVK